MIPLIYEYTTDPTYTSFSFKSIGPNGIIQKIVTFNPIPDFILDGEQQVINLGFGDWDEKTLKVDDSSNSNNGDRDKVLSTVASTIFAFCDKHGNLPIFARGSSPCRTRLYQMGINANRIEVERLFYVYGLLNGEWQEFATGVNYDAFLVIRK